MASEEIEKFFCDKNIKTLENLNIQRKNGKFCDFTIKTTNGDSFTVHKCVISAVSSFFETKFNSNFNDSTSEMSEFPHVSAVILEKIIEFMYIGKIKISSKDAREILDTSLFLGLDNVVDNCTDVLAETVNNTNCFDLLSYSETYHRSENLANKCAKFFLTNMKIMMNETGFVNMSHQSMNLMVLTNRNQCNEELLYSSLIKWISSNTEEREQYICPLLDKIRFELISYEYFASNIMENSPLQDNKYFLKKMFEIQKQNILLDVENGKKSKSVLQSRTEQTISRNMIYTVIGKNMNVFGCPTLVTNVNCELYSFTILADRKFVICGGMPTSVKETSLKMKACQYFSFPEKEWHQLPSIKNARYDHRAVAFGDQIYVCGGKDEKTVEIFDVNKSLWSDGPSLSEAMDEFGLCTFNNCIYAVDKNNFEFLDPRENSWKQLPTPTSYYSAAFGHGNYIYKFGKKGLDRFDLRSNKWDADKLRFNEKELENAPFVFILENEVYMLGKCDTDKYLMQIHDICNEMSIIKSYTITWPSNDRVNALFATSYLP